MRNSRLIALLCALCGMSVTLFCQQVLDTSFRQNSINNLTNYYRTSLGLQAHLYNGPLYEQYPRRFIAGHQYFVSDSINKGFVSYDGMEYWDVRMQYDIVRDELVIFHPNGFPLNLIKEKVDSFFLLDHHFIKLKSLKVAGSLDSIGYYDKVYSSPSISFLVKRQKYIQETSGSSSIETNVYEKKNVYYIFKKGFYRQVSTKKSVLELLKDKKHETQQYIKNNKLRFKNFEHDVLQIVNYYSQLM